MPSRYPRTRRLLALLGEAQRQVTALVVLWRQLLANRASLRSLPPPQSQADQERIASLWNAQTALHWHLLAVTTGHEDLMARLFLAMRSARDAWQSGEEPYRRRVRLRVQHAQEQFEGATSQLQSLADQDPFSRPPVPAPTTGV